MASLGSIALALPDVEEGIACAGTSLESRTYSVKKRNFLFVSGKEARLKLSKSAAEAKRLGCEVGANGWVKLPLDAMPPAAVVRRWIAESHDLVAAGSGAPKTRMRIARTKRPKR